MKRFPKLLSFLLVMVMLAGSVVVLDQSIGTAQAATIYIDTDFESNTSEGWGKLSGSQSIVSNIKHTGSYAMYVNSGYSVFNCSAKITSYYASFWIQLNDPAGYVDHIWNDRVFDGSSYKWYGLWLEVDSSKKIAYSGSDSSYVSTGYTIEPSTGFHNIQIWVNDATFDIQLDSQTKVTGLPTGYDSTAGITSIQIGGTSTGFYIDDVILSAGTSEHPAWFPAFTSTPGTSSQVGSTYSYTPTTNETATITVPTLPAWASFSSGIVSGTPASAGSYPFSLKAVSTAGTLSSYQNWTVTVSELISSAWAPSFTTTPPDGGTVGEEYGYAPQCNETVTWALDQGPEDCDFFTDDGSIAWHPSDAGSYAFNLKATSTAGTLSSYQNWTVSVVDPTLVPAFLNSPDTNASKRVWYSWTPSVTMDCTYTLNTTAGFLTINEYTGQVIGIPTSAGTYHVTITATSIEYGTSATLSYDLTVGNYVLPYDDGSGGSTDSGGSNDTGGGSTIIADISGHYLWTILVIVIVFGVVILLASRRR